MFTHLHFKGDSIPECTISFVLRLLVLLLLVLVADVKITRPHPEFSVLFCFSHRKVVSMGCSENVTLVEM